jgi:glycosyltransferase involved in cell wall biosynthesis
MPALSILIPARNEMFLARTVQDILEHSEADTEIIVVLDGVPADPPVPADPRVRVVELSESIGQRAATNLAARMSEAPYVIKCDAHCSFGQGFDRIMLEDMAGHDDWAMVPIMRNLWAFNWLCQNGHRRYQGPSGPCEICGEPTEREMVWIAKEKPQSKSYCFDAEPHFQYFKAFSKRPEGKGDITETMSLQGSCWLVPRDLYWRLNLCDEAFGSWGSQGIEVSVKVWLSGGRVVCNQRTYYGHLFRTQGGDFGFPYAITGAQVENAKERARELFFRATWPGAIRPLSWLVERFWPVPGWTEADLCALKDAEGATTPEPAPVTAGIVYYTDNRLSPAIMRACQKQLAKAGLHIVSVSLAPLDFGHNIVLDAERGILTMFRQQLAGLEASTADVIFMCEHDVLYHPSHFDFRPPRKDTFYYNTAVWKCRYPDGHAVWTDDLQQVSGLCAYRGLLIDYYRRKIAEYERGEFDRHFEPGEKTGDTSANWQSAVCNIDIRHDQTLTRSKWSPDEFRNKRYARGWKETDDIPGWGRFKEVFDGLSE